MAYGPRKNGGAGSGRTLQSPCLSRGRGRSRQADLVVSEGEGALDWAGKKEMGRQWNFGPRERKEKGRGRKERWAGWAQREREKRKALHFLKKNKHIQI